MDPLSQSEDIGYVLLLFSATKVVTAYLCMLCANGSPWKNNTSFCVYSHGI